MSVKFFLVMILIVILNLVSGVRPIFSSSVVKTEPYIQIRPDGSVVMFLHGNATFIQCNGSTYTFTANIYSSEHQLAIVVEKDNIILDGAGYTLQGTGVYRSIGIDLTGRSSVTIKNMKIEGFGYGIYLENSSNNTINENSISNNTDNTYEMQSGIAFFGSSNNTISRNNITANDKTGIYLVNSSNNTISGNNITDNSWMGFYLRSSSSNVIHGNCITDHGEGISLYGSSGNMIYHNDFINNTEQVAIWLGPLSGNLWVDGVEGNYWSDYKEEYPNATEIDNSGIWDTPYVITVYPFSDNIDRYPRVIPEFPSFLILPLFMISTLLAIIIHRRRISKQVSAETCTTK